MPRTCATRSTLADRGISTAPDATESEWQTPGQFHRAYERGGPSRGPFQSSCGKRDAGDCGAASTGSSDTRPMSQAAPARTVKRRAMMHHIAADCRFSSKCATGTSVASTPASPQTVPAMAFLSGSA